ncbi:outer membrane beta-barrel protein [Hymenobacter sp. GOD-10R]|uniref:outer membrane beta-barrel protein n=1 Tax=Hymenobacter sp. GOD-10R TaxID=3093922 RepID=UPI002D79956C|nr:outer membrane beta-barrel protein [Hymenobacter sp. GOD-10R]WRQ28239.1 outer membrane beta-barrel protein [Hymenobacter sp. GOD-10R]
MRKFILLSFLFLTGLAPVAKAQVDIHIKVDPLSSLKLRYGVRAGAQVTSMTTKPSDFSGPPSFYADFNPKNNFWNGQAGFVLDASFGWLSVQPAVVFSQKGYRINESWQRQLSGTVYDVKSFTRLRLNYLEVPVNLVVTVRGLQLFAGPYLGVALSGEYQDHYAGPVRASESRPIYAFDDWSYKQKLRIGKSSSPYYNDAFRRLDAGYNVGIGYKLGPWQAQLSHMHGVKNTYPSPSIGYNPQVKNRGYQLNATYFFGQP